MKRVYSCPKIILVYGQELGSDMVAKIQMENASIAIIKATVDAWNRHDVETLSSYLSDDIMLLHPSLNEPLRGKDKYIEYDRAFLQSFPDAHIEIVNILNQNELIAFEFIMSGTHLGAFKGRAATGKKINIPVVEMTLLCDGKICEVRRYLDTNTYSKQLS